MHGLKKGWEEKGLYECIYEEIKSYAGHLNPVAFIFLVIFSQILKQRQSTKALELLTWYIFTERL